jgi:hypothetical protein
MWLFLYSWFVVKYVIPSFKILEICNKVYKGPIGTFQCKHSVCVRCMLCSETSKFLW